MTPTKFPNTPLQLEEYFLNSLNVEWRQFTGDGEYKITGVKLDVDYDLDIHADNAHAYQMTLSVIGEQTFENAASCGYKFACVIVGRYRLENAKPEQEHMLARMNGVSLLYSTLRGTIGMVTGSFEHGKIDLPAIDPRAIVKQVEDKRHPGPPGPTSSESTTPTSPAVVERSHKTLDSAKK